MKRSHRWTWMIGLFALVLLNPLAAKAADLPTAAPEKVGMSSQRLARIKPVMARYVEQNLIAGAAWLVARKGKVVHFESVGYREAETKSPLNTDAIFRIASMTKPITTTALMMLYEEGQFQLSDPVWKWIPEFRKVEVAVDRESGDPGDKPYKLVKAKRPITIHHLLTHTAGLSNEYVGKYTQDLYRAASKRQRPDETIADFVKRYAEIPLNYQPGEAWQYSRATCVVGRLVEIMSGMTLDEFFRKRIFEPLKMTDTHFYLPQAKLGRFTAAYKPGQEKKLEPIDPAGAESSFVKEPHVYFMGSGGLVSTTADYFRFCQMLLNRGQLDGARLLGRKTVEFMSQSHTGDLPIWLTGPGTGFGLGFGVKTQAAAENILVRESWQQGPVPGSTGTFSWGGAYCTIFFIDPKEELIGIMMTQVRPYNHLNIRNDFIGLAYQAIVD